jgi:hypothetical protein
MGALKTHAHLDRRGELPAEVVVKAVHEPRVCVCDDGCQLARNLAILKQDARWHIIKPKIPIWINFGGLCNGRCCFLYIYLVYLMAIWYILGLFGIFFPGLFGRKNTFVHNFMISTQERLRDNEREKEKDRVRRERVERKKQGAHFCCCIYKSAQFFWRWGWGCDECILWLGTSTFVCT